LANFVSQSLKHMGQKTNPNIYNQTEKLTKQSLYIEKKIVDHSIFLKRDLEVKNFSKKFFQLFRILIAKSRMLCLNNLLYVYLPYYLELNDDFLSLNQLCRTSIIKNCFSCRKIKRIKRLKKHVLKKSIKDNTFLLKTVQYVSIKTNRILELNRFLEAFCIGLTQFLRNKFYIYLILEKQNKKLATLHKKSVVIKRKHKFIHLRRYKDQNFFKQGVSLITACIANENASELLARYIAVQIKKLKRQKFFIRFVKSTLNLFNNKIFYSRIKGIKIQIKGRFNNYPRARVYVVKISNVPPVLTKSANINFNEKVSHTQSGTFGIKV
jgi:hypothetical protein